MKTSIIILLILLSGTAFGQNAKVKVHIEFRGIEAGYDHLTKDEIYIDGQLVTVTPERKESEAVDMTIKVSAGTHTFRIVNWTLYEGNWEETKIDNQYNIDGFGEAECKCGKKGSVSVLYDLDDRNSPFITCN